MIICSTCGENALHCRCLGGRIKLATPKTARADSVALHRLVGRRFVRLADGAEARVMAEAEGNVMYRYKGAAAHATTRADFLAKHVERTKATPNDEALRRGEETP